MINPKHDNLNRTWAQNSKRLVHSPNKITNHNIHPGLIALLLTAFSLLFSQCSVLGYLIGQAADPQPYYNPIRMETITKVKPGKKIKLILHDGSIAYGKLYALGYMPLEDYAPAYDRARKKLEGLTLLPDLGDSLFVIQKYQNPDSTESAARQIFSGFGVNRILLTSHVDRIRAIPLDSLLLLTDSGSNKFDIAALSDHLANSRIPARSVIRLINNELLLDFRVMDINQIGLKAHRGEWTGFALGAIVDGIVIIIVSAFMIDFEQSQ